MPESKDSDYILGTTDKEIQRLGLQHQAWRPIVLDCWEKAGITKGSRVIDIGAGPGYATFDLAKIVGETGEVVAIERSSNFIEFIRKNCKSKRLNIQVYEKDLMVDTLPEGNFDYSWCRWVTSFVSSPEILVEKTYKTLRKGGKAIFHEYCDYTTWKLSPTNKALEEFVQIVMKSWRKNGGEPDIALLLVNLLNKRGFLIRKTSPLVYSLQHTDYMWKWLSTFINSYMPRLKELGEVDEKWIIKVSNEIEIASLNPNSIMMSPMVLEIVAEKI
jgi:SAM-dependent methyltransferase